MSNSHSNENISMSMGIFPRIARRKNQQQQVMEERKNGKRYPKRWVLVEIEPSILFLQMMRALPMLVRNLMSNMFQTLQKW